MQDVMVAVADYSMPARVLRGYRYDHKPISRHGLTWAPDGRPSVDALKAYKRPMSQRRTHFLIFEFRESSIDWSPRRVQSMYSLASSARIICAFVFLE